MSIVAIDGVRWTNDRVTHVRWGNIDELTANWTTVPKVVDVDRVVKVLEKGELVRTVFKLGGRSYLGPQVSSIPYANGHIGIETSFEEGRIEKTLEDLPSV
jgi:hypothetical protein